MEVELENDFDKITTKLGIEMPARMALMAAGIAV